jgi:fermentation-respiration switch protein FrsA (DUF1100 family)
MGLILTFAIVVYAAMSGLVWAFQDSIVYQNSANRAVPPAELPITEVEIPTSDGETLIGWRMDAAENCPTFLLFHGNAGHLELGFWQYRRIANAGAGMLAVSWRGYAGSTGSPSETGLYEDAEAGLAYLEAEGLAGEQIVIHGFSLGSAPAIRVAGRHDVAALILEAPYFSIERLARERLSVLPVSWLLRDRYRSNEMIGDVTEPILIVHGDADSVIPARHSEDLAALAQAPTERIVFAGSDHNTLVRDGLYEQAIWPYLGQLYPNCPFAATNMET